MTDRFVMTKLTVDTLVCFACLSCNLRQSTGTTGPDSWARIECGNVKCNAQIQEVYTDPKGQKAASERVVELWRKELTEVCAQAMDKMFGYTARIEAGLAVDFGDDK